MMFFLHACNFSWWNCICEGVGKKTKLMFQSACINTILEHQFFCPHLHKSNFIMKFCMHVDIKQCFLSKSSFFWIFKIFFEIYYSSWITGDRDHILHVIWTIHIIRVFDNLPYIVSVEGIRGPTNPSTEKLSKWWGQMCAK